MSLENNKFVDKFTMVAVKLGIKFIYVHYVMHLRQ